MKTRVPQGGPLRLAATRASSASRIRCTRRSSCRSCGRTSCRPPPDHATQAALERDLPQRLPGEAGRAGDPRASRALRRPAHGQAADRAPRRAPAPDRRRDHDDRLGVDRRRSPASSSSTRRTSRAGTTRAGSTPRRSAAAGSPSSGSSRTASSTREGRRSRATPTTRRSHRALAFWNNPPLSDATHVALHALRARARSRDAGKDELEAAAVPGARRERAAPADRHLAGAADVVTNNSRVVCDECTRADAAARRRGTRPAVDRARHADAGRHRPDAAQLRRALARARALGLRRRAPAALRRGHRERRDGAARSRSSSPCSCRAAPTRSRCSIRDGDPLYREAARQALALTGGTPFTEDARLLLASGARAARAAARRGQGQRAAGVGYDHPDQSHFTSRHFWEVGATDPRLLTGWLGRYLDDVGVARQPAAGALARPARCSRRSRRRRCRSRRSTGPSQYDFWVPGVWGQRRDADARRDRDARRDPLAATPAFATVAGRHRARRPLRRQLQPFAAQGRGHAAGRRTRRRTTRSRRSLQGLAAMIAAGLPLRCVALEASGDVRHARRPDRGADARARRRRPRRSSPSSATSRRAASPTACSRSSGRSSAGARRRTARAGPTTAPPAPAS